MVKVYGNESVCSEGGAMSMNVKRLQPRQDESSSLNVQCLV